MQKQKSLFWQYLILILFVSNLKSADFNILFSANINGNLENCMCGKIPLGGVARIKSFVDDYLNKNENCIVIDGGDFFNSYPFFELNQAMLKSLELINYDLFLPGDQEFVEGIEFFNFLRGKLRNNLFISNLVNQKDRKKRFIFNKKEVEIYCFLSPKSFEFIAIPKNISLSPFSSLQAEINQNACNIVVFHGPLEEAEKYAQEYQWIDLILLAHDQKVDSKQLPRTKIVGSGQDSEYINVIAVEQSNDYWNFDINQKPIKLTIPEDKKISQIIKSYQELQNN
jgi:2',3'-cyclic-nucleotide 2'-phosphodiesterase (5'-nucleotidase family)